MNGELLLDRYQIDSDLGMGTSGHVWGGIDTQTGRSVVIKLSPEGADLGRVLLEGEAMAAVRHPNVVQLLDFGLHEGRPCLVRESADGELWADRLRAAGHMTWFAAFEFAAQVLDGLAALHEQDLVHGDISPDSVVLGGSGSGVKLVGLAQVSLVTSDSSRAAPLPAATGALAYKAPEQLSRTRLRPASDLYAVGVLLYEAIVGVSPFAARPTDLSARLSFCLDFDALPAGSPALPRSARFAIECMLRPSSARRETDARLCARRLRTALGIDMAPVAEEPSQPIVVAHASA